MYTTRVLFVMASNTAIAWASLFQTFIMICDSDEKQLEVEAVGRGKMCAVLCTKQPWQEQYSETIRLMAQARLIEEDYSIGE